VLAGRRFRSALVFKVALLYRRNNPRLTFKTSAFFEEIDCLPGYAPDLAADGNVSIGALKSSQLVTRRYDCVAGNVSERPLKFEERCIVSANAPALFAKLGCHDGLGALPPAASIRCPQNVLPLITAPGVTR
jgi:hypothetical protein